MKLAILGAGWAGMAAAVTACQAGHQVTVFEAARSLGGRARAVPAQLPDGSPVTLDNGQHILIGAYSDSLRLMRCVGLDPDALLLRQPLTLQFPNGQGLALPRWPSPWDALAGIASNRAWRWRDKLALLARSARWQLQGFRCAPHISVAELCAGLGPTLMDTLIEPLCISALNTPASRASGQVFLRVLQDSLLGGSGASHLLLPRTDLGALFPQAAANWLQARGGTVHTGQRAKLQHTSGPQPWQVNGQGFDAVVCATSSTNAVQVLAECAQTAPKTIANSLQNWSLATQALGFEAITTVYAYAPGLRLAQPMLALPSNPSAPAQFVFDRGQLGGPSGLLAFVISASVGERATLQAQVLAQAQAQLGVALQDLTPLQTVVEKRATFACTPGLLRPPSPIAPGLLAAGDYIDGPYPATLEGAVRSGCAAAAALHT